MLGYAVLRASFLAGIALHFSSLQVYAAGLTLPHLPAWPISNVGSEIPASIIGSWMGKDKTNVCAGIKGQFSTFPSKIDNPKSMDPKLPDDPASLDPDTLCNDGDMTLFNGLLCAAGVEDGCVGVAEAQGPDGQWFRSPHRRWMRYHRCFDKANPLTAANFGGDCANGFSPDMSLGVMLYVVEKNAVGKYESWLKWIDSNAATTQLCTLNGTVTTNCTIEWWPRVCDYDLGYSDKPGYPILGKYGGQCSLSPLHDFDFDATSEAIAATVPSGLVKWDASMRAALPSLLPALAIVPGADALGNVPPLIISSSVDAAYYPLHLDAVRVLLRMMILNPGLKQDPIESLPDGSDASALLPVFGYDDVSPELVHAAALIVTGKAGWNPFYHLLSDGPTPSVRNMILDRCPHAGEKSQGSNWEWELNIKDSTTTRLNSMGWDCVFVANLYNKMRVRAKLVAQLLALFNKYGLTLDRDIPLAQHTIGLAQAANGAAQTALNQATKALSDRQTVVNAYTGLHTAAVKALNDDTAKVVQLQAQLAALQKQAGNLAVQAAAMPDTIQTNVVNQVCSIVGKILGSLGRQVCHNVVTVVNIPNAAKAGIVRNLANVNAQIANLQTSAISSAQKQVSQDAKIVSNLDNSFQIANAELAQGALQLAVASANLQFVATAKALQAASDALTIVQRADTRVKAYEAVWSGAK